MTYELAKELKEAGFPQEGKGEFMLFKAPSLGPSAGMILGDTKMTYLPTLSELIEGCGLQFGSLQRVAGLAWSAFNSEGDPVNPPLSAKGNSPEEAVARLYIALNAKS